MAHFDKESGQIILSTEDEKMFREVKSQFTPQGQKSSQWVKDLINYIYGK